MKTRRRRCRILLTTRVRAGTVARNGADTVIVNVAGSAVRLDDNFLGDATGLGEHVIWNFPTATSLESIMLDEGFGTLDPGTLDTVAATLENLAAHGDRMVGLVTHVAELAERIPVRFKVRKDARGAHVTREST